MDDLLKTLYSAYTKPGMAEYVKFLVEQGPATLETVQLYTTLTGCFSCLIHVSERRDKLTSTRRTAFEHLLSDAQLQEGLKMFVADIKEVDETEPLLANLRRHAFAVKALDDRYSTFLTECGCSS